MLAEVEREIDRLASERQNWWRAWERRGWVTPEAVEQRREQLRALERRLQVLWAKKRLELARSGASWEERELWRMVAGWERDELESR